MNASPSEESFMPGFDLPAHAFDYALDAFQRSILFMDILRKRGNIYYDHLLSDQPPVLSFPYETIIDGLDLAPPVNYCLARIIDRRDDEDKRSVEKGATTKVRGVDRRANVPEKPQPHPGKRPIVIIDPRAGHGPGIGGSKRDSEIGMALAHGHPVYFILFYTDPCPGQTLTDVLNTEVLFLEEIRRRHPHAEKPAVIGNCQGGWAAALIGASRPDVTGPMVFNGSPLSYWSGVDGKNPMRYKGGLCGGTWMASLWSDLGNGKFDGANLVHGFEDLNPANTLWNKQYNLYASVDREEKRYLDFERWWNGYFYMTAEEIHFIVENLFMGNRLEHGFLELDEQKLVNLKNIEDPVLVFASSGDNITPPQQALNWIMEVWETEEEIKRNHQVIVYLLHETIGHLGIFVSGKVSKKEHKEIIGSIDLMEYLSPGLYEMIIETDREDPHSGLYDVRFEARDYDDILRLDDDLDDEDFRVVCAASEANDALYRTYMSPFVKLFSNDFTAEWLRQLHPLRASRYAFSDMNFSLLPLKEIAPLVKKYRARASDDNPFTAAEKILSDSVAGMLDCFRDVRDMSQEYLFKATYGNPLLTACFPEAFEEREKPEKKRKIVKTGEQYWLDAMEKGGFAEGILRLMIAMSHADSIYDRKELELMRKLIKVHNVLTNTTESEMKRIIQKQARILQIDKKMAVEALPKLIRTPENRLTALMIVEAVAGADSVVSPEEELLLTQVKELLSDRKTL